MQCNEQRNPAAYMAWTCAGLLLVALFLNTGTHAKRPSLEGQASADPTTTTSIATPITITRGSFDEQADRLGIPAEYRPFFLEASERTGIDPIVLAAQVHLESHFTNHACRRVKRETICGVAQLGNGFGTQAERMDPHYAINRQADAIKEFLDQYDGNLDMAFRRYFSGSPVVGQGACGKTCRKYPGLVYSRIAQAEGV
jgi:soluble lytic murein transglycosylase-like protein